MDMKNSKTVNVKNIQEEIEKVKISLIKSGAFINL